MRHGAQSAADGSVAAAWTSGGGGCHPQQTLLGAKAPGARPYRTSCVNLHRGCSLHRAEMVPRLQKGAGASALALLALFAACAVQVRSRPVGAGSWPLQAAASRRGGSWGGLPITLFKLRTQSRFVVTEQSAARWTPPQLLATGHLPPPPPADDLNERTPQHSLPHTPTHPHRARWQGLCWMPPHLPRPQKSPAAAWRPPRRRP